MSMLTLATGARAAQAPREPHSTHVVPALKQTGSAFKDKKGNMVTLHSWSVSKDIHTNIFLEVTVGDKLSLQAFVHTTPNALMIFNWDLV